MVSGRCRVCRGVWQMLHLAEGRLADGIWQMPSGRRRVCRGVLQAPSDRRCLPDGPLSDAVCQMGRLAEGCLSDGVCQTPCLPDAIWQRAVWQTQHLADTVSGRHCLPDAVCRPAGVWLPDLPDAVSFYVAIGLSMRVKPGNKARLNSCVF